MSEERRPLSIEERRERAARILSVGMLRLLARRKREAEGEQESRNLREGEH